MIEETESTAAEKAVELHDPLPKDQITLKAAPGLLSKAETATQPGDVQFALLKVTTFNPSGQEIGFYLCFQVTEEYTPEKVQEFFEQNKKHFGADPKGIEEVLRFNSFKEMETYVHDKSTVNWNGKDIYCWPAQQF